MPRESLSEMAARRRAQENERSRHQYTPFPTAHCGDGGLNPTTPSFLVGLLFPRPCLLQRFPGFLIALLPAGKAH